MGTKEADKKYREANREKINEKKREYDKAKREENAFVFKRLKFARAKSDDVEILNFLDTKENYSKYIKELIRKDMNEQKEL